MKMKSKYKSLLYTILGIIIGFWLTLYKNYYLKSNEIILDESNSLKIDNDFQTETFIYENRTIADKLAKEVRILCWILTDASNHKKALHIKRTWGARCNKLLFMSTKRDLMLNSVKLPVKEGQDNLWGKTKEAFKYIHKNYMNEADWFLKADDDTYVVVENLRLMLYPHKPETPIYFGSRFKPFDKQGYMSGGAGYVLSKEAVKRLVEKGLPNKNACRARNSGAEDAELGICLANLNVVAGDSRDNKQRMTFFSVKLSLHLTNLNKNADSWYWKYAFYKTKKGFDCCSDHAISFHYITPGSMYLYEYLIYGTQVYGKTHAIEPLPTEKIPSEVDIVLAKEDRQKEKPNYMKLLKG